MDVLVFVQQLIERRHCGDDISGIRVLPLKVNWIKELDAMCSPQKFYKEISVEVHRVGFIVFGEIIHPTLRRRYLGYECISCELGVLGEV
jgi:hypothetical protein